MPQKLTWTLVFLSLSLALAGCQEYAAGTESLRSAASPTASTTATALPATPTPTTTATPLPPATSTLTPTPRPSSTPTPRPLPSNTVTPVPSAPPTPPVQIGPLSVEPARVAQGKTALVRVRTSAGDRVQGSLAGTPLVFAQGEAEAWAVAGIPGLAQPGPRTVEVRVTARSSQVTSYQAIVEVVETNWPVENIVLPPGQGDLLAPSIVVSERDLLQTVSRQATAPPRWQGVFLRPAAGPVSSAFGDRRSYNGGPPTGQHEGTDFALETGAPVRTAAAGKVAVARQLQVRGQAVLIDHGAGVITGYYHLSEMLVQQGQEVARGAPIGRAGSTGLATGPHLHWDLLIGGVNVDPAEWLERAIP